MALFVELTQRKEDRKIIANLDHIVGFNSTKSGDGTIILFVDEMEIIVSEQYDVIKSMISSLTWKEKP